MPAPTRHCAAHLLYRDEHKVGPRWWTVTTPDGAIYDICSAACLTSYAVLGALPAELDVSGRENPRAREAGNATLRRSTTEAA